MWIQPGALPRVPDYAVVLESEIEGALRELSGDSSGAAQAELDRAFRQLEGAQPELAAFVSYELSNLEGQAAQALLYMLALVVFRAFRAAFGARLRPLEKADLDDALEHLIVDSEVRSQTGSAPSFSEDAVALGQPALMRFVNQELEHARPAQEVLAPIMEAVLIEVLALQAAVSPT